MGDAGRLVALGADHHDLAGVYGGLDLNYAALLTLLAGLLMLGRNGNALDDDLALLGHGGQDFALLALIAAGQDDNLIILFNVHFRALLI